jgi:hypothetical protein
MARAEAHDNVDDRHSRAAGDVEETRRSVEERLFVNGVAIDDQGLEIHNEKRGGLGVDRNFFGHDDILIGVAGQVFAN